MLKERSHDQRRRARVLVAMLLGALVGCEPTSDTPVLSVHGGQLRAHALDGRALPVTAVIGVELTLPDASDRPMRVRIDSIAPDPTESSPLMMFGVSRFDETTERWVPHCQPGPDGLAMALPLAGRWRANGTAFVEDPHDFTLTCTAGANGKCARLGYLPGHVTPDGKSLTPYFEACVRMMRADYCGDGRSTTEAGVPVDMVDSAGRQPTWFDPDLTFEAAWGPGGAICVTRPRNPALSLEALVERCPRLRDEMEEPCLEELLISRPDVLLINRSPEPEA